MIFLATSAGGQLPLSPPLGSTPVWDPPILKEIHILTKLGLGGNSDTVWHLILLCNLPSNMEFPHKWLKTLKRNNVVVFEYYFKKYIGQYVGNLQYNIIGKNIVSIAKYIEIYQIHQSIHNKKWENLSEQIDKIIS